MSYKQLTENERYQICVMKKGGHSQKTIADYLHRSPSTISRELHRNSGPRGYRPGRAHQRCVTRRREAYKAFKVTDQVWIWIVRLIEQELSPQQTVDYLKNHKKVSLHHETVYQLIYADKAVTMVERKTLYAVIVRLSGKRADLLAEAAVKHMKALQAKVKTITFDNGREFTEHEAIAKGLSADVYFAHPYASWERGINENTNGLIRQYFPKGTDFNKVTDEQVEAVMIRLNNRPRKTRGCKSPNELFMGQRVDLLAA